VSRALPPSPLDSLPLFASDQAIAEAIVGKKDAKKWLLDRLPTLESKIGFPKIDPVHGGRAVPLVRLFYQNYLRLPEDMKGPPDGEEDETAWNRSRRRA
jgi:hypothetical protein